MIEPTAPQLDRAIFGLDRRSPAASARRLFDRRQTTILLLHSTALAAFAAAAPKAALCIIFVLLTGFFISAIAFRIVVAAASMRPPTPPAPRLADGDLPTVTILLPLFREAASLPGLAAAIRRIDYPAGKLDIKLILEEADEETIEAARKLELSSVWDLTSVPNAAPQTKPKACNYALAGARGSLVVIYDAEDEPEPDQLRKAAAAFAAADDRLACVQARLAFYNARENWLTRLFALEYCLWFDTLLPGLQRLGLPIPLGGTSNIFRTDVLLDVGAWDPFNVTEDADLGLRLARRGWRTEVIDSTTFEEANCRLGNWIRQRSRWIKGYAQTWIVHSRNIGDLVRVAGWKSLLTTQLFVGGTVVSAVFGPALWIIQILGVAGAPVDAWLTTPLHKANGLALAAGNLVYAALAVAAPFRRGWGGLAPAALLSPVYWLMTSAAGLKGLFQLVTRPHFWEKTAHMISANRDGCAAPLQEPPVGAK